MMISLSTTFSSFADFPRSILLGITSCRIPLEEDHAVVRVGNPALRISGKHPRGKDTIATLVVDLQADIGELELLWDTFLTIGVESDGSGLPRVISFLFCLRNDCVKSLLNILFNEFKPIWLE
jgi:hypothetical protein